MIKTNKKQIDLTGSWRAVYSEINGEMSSVAHFSTIKITFRKDKFEIESDGKIKHLGTYNLNCDVSPAQITYTYEKSSFYKTNTPRIGIVQLNGDTLKDCLGAIGDKPPRAFNSKAGSGKVLTIHQRVGSEGGIKLGSIGDVSEW